VPNNKDQPDLDSIFKQVKDLRNALRSNAYAIYCKETLAELMQKHPG
jgi:hypothetical protein